MTTTLDPKWDELARTGRMRVDRNIEDGRLRITAWRSSLDLHSDGCDSSLTIELPQEIRAAIAETYPPNPEKTAEDAEMKETLELVIRQAIVRAERIAQDLVGIRLAWATEGGSAVEERVGIKTWRPELVGTWYEASDGVHRLHVDGILIGEVTPHPKQNERWQGWKQKQLLGTFDTAILAREHIEMTVRNDAMRPDPEPTIQRAKWNGTGGPAIAEGGILNELCDVKTREILGWVECDGPVGGPNTTYFGDAGWATKAFTTWHGAHAWVRSELGFSDTPDESGALTREVKP